MRTPCQYLATGTFDNLVLCVILETPDRNSPGPAILSLWWNDSIDVSVFKQLVIHAVCITGVGCNRLDLPAGVVLNAFYLFRKLIAFTLLAGGYIYIDNNATGIVNRSVLLVGRLHAIRIA